MRKYCNICKIRLDDDAMANRSIRSYLPTKRNEKTEVIQARISSEMKRRIDEIATKNKWKPSEVLRAVLEKFCDDQALKKTG